MKTYETSKTLVRAFNAFEPVAEDVTIPGTLGWSGRSDEIHLKKGEKLEVVEHGDAENFSVFRIVPPYRITFPEGYQKPKLPWGKKWVEALRSGNYRQTRDKLIVLCDDKERIMYCCLGVLCKIQGRLTEDGYDGNGSEKTSFTLSKENPVVMAGFSKIGSFPEGVTVNLKKNLIDLNDSVSRLENGFNIIADVIEAIWECGDEEIPK